MNKTLKRAPSHQKSRPPLTDRTNILAQKIKAPTAIQEGNMIKKVARQ